MPITRVQFDKEDQDDHSVTFKQTRSDNGETVDYTFTQSAEGAIEVSANGVCVLTLSVDGFLRRTPDVSADAGVRRTADGKMAMPGRRS
jgi:hypothetical protein